jgi:hypothetical protein
MIWRRMRFPSVLVSPSTRVTSGMYFPLDRRSPPAPARVERQSVGRRLGDPDRADRYIRCDISIKQEADRRPGFARGRCTG